MQKLTLTSSFTEKELERLYEIADVHPANKRFDTDALVRIVKYAANTESLRKPTMENLT